MDDLNSTRELLLVLDRLHALEARIMQLESKAYRTDFQASLMDLTKRILELERILCTAPLFDSKQD